MRVCIIGAGPSGLAQLRAFESAERNGEKSQKLFVMRNKKTGEVFGTIPGEQELMNMENLYIVVCIAIFGLMVLKNV